MENVDNSEPQNPAKIEYKREGKFLNIVMPIREMCIKSIRAKGKTYKRSIEIVDTNVGKSIFINGKSKIGMLADFLEMKRAEMLVLVDREDLGKLTEIIAKQPKNRLVQINASDFTYPDRAAGKYVTKTFVFAISTIQHKMVTFTQLDNIIVNILKPVEAKTVEVTNSKIWTRKYPAFQTNDGNRFAAEIVVTSGKNTKASAIKVIVRIWVAKCKNSIVCANYTAIKRTENWQDRLTQTLTYAVEVAETSQKMLIEGAKKELTYEQGIKYIENLKLSIRIPEKVNAIKSALIAQFETEYKQSPNRFGLSQTLSFVGTHFLPEKTSARTLEMLQEQAFAILIQDLVQ